MFSEYENLAKTFCVAAVSFSYFESGKVTLIAEGGTNNKVALGFILASKPKIETDDQNNVTAMLAVLGAGQGPPIEVKLRREYHDDGTHLLLGSPDDALLESLMSGQSLMLTIDSVGEISANLGSSRQAIELWLRCADRNQVTPKARNPKPFWPRLYGEGTTVGAFWKILFEGRGKLRNGDQT